MRSGRYTQSRGLLASDSSHLRLTSGPLPLLGHLGLELMVWSWTFGILVPSRLRIDLSFHSFPSRRVETTMPGAVSCTFVRVGCLRGCRLARRRLPISLYVGCASSVCLNAVTYQAR
eukprot:COSAG06_NODE_5535_length_3418_cov_85.411146_1_plen_117_part_00